MSVTCRSCGAPILWAITATGKRMPLDAEPAAKGGIFTLDYTYSDGPRAASVAAVYRSHFATCPNAAQHRRPQEPA